MEPTRTQPPRKAKKQRPRRRPAPAAALRQVSPSPIGELVTLSVEDILERERSMLQELDRIREWRKRIAGQPQPVALASAPVDLYEQPETHPTHPSPGRRAQGRQPSAWTDDEEDAPSSPGHLRPDPETAFV